MRRFRFGLEKILKLRMYREREWELKLAEVTGECNRLRRVIDDTEAEKRSVLRWRIEYGEGIDGWRLAELYVQRLSGRSARAKAELETAERRRAEVQQQYLEASMKRKVLENLKERKAGEYRRIQLQEEIKTIDDINTGRSAVRRG